MEGKICVWCGKGYEEHVLAHPQGAVPKVPCGMLRSGFLEKPSGQQASPLVVESTEDHSIQVKNELTFPDAMREVINGNRITRLEWNDENVFCLLRDTFLMIYINNQFHTWKINDGDLLATDWVVLEDVKN
jgi:hypothetical protein